MERGECRASRVPTTGNEWLLIYTRASLLHRKSSIVEPSWKNTKKRLTRRMQGRHNSYSIRSAHFISNLVFLEFTLGAGATAMYHM